MSKQELINAISALNMVLHTYGELGIGRLETKAVLDKLLKLIEEL